MHIVVIGAGISGLASAFRIREQLLKARIDFRLTILEAKKEAGGTISTFRHKGWQIESGPNGFLDSKPGTLRLVSALGLEHRLLPADHASKKRFLYIDGKLLELPVSPIAFLGSPVLSVGARLRFLLEPFMPKGADDETVAQLGRRRLGKQAVERLLDPMVSGIFAGNVEELSVESAFPAVKALEREHGSLIRGMLTKMRARKKSTQGNQLKSGGPAGPGGLLHSLKGGMGELIEALSVSLEKSLRTDAVVSRITKESGKTYAVEIEGIEEILHADVLVSAAPAYKASSYFASLDTKLSRELSEIPYAPITVVAVGLRETSLHSPLDGFGFLIPSSENEQILGCLWSSSIYPGHRAPADHVLTRTMIGGANRAHLALLPDEELIKIVREAHLKTMSLSWKKPDCLRIIRYEKGIPQYPVGHRDRMSRIANITGSYPGLFITGNHMHGVGVNDCTSNAEAIAENIMAYLSTRSSYA